MANKDAVGLTGPAFIIDVERGKVREFARATGSRNDAYLDAEHPPIPPTFLMTTAFWQPPEAGDLFKALDIDLRRLLHGEQSYVFHGPPPSAGTTLTAVTRVESVTEKEGKRGGTMTFCVTVTDFTDETGALRVQARSTAIETGRAPS